jgi:hypothetical protein
MKNKISNLTGNSDTIPLNDPKKVQFPKDVTFSRNNVMPLNKAKNKPKEMAVCSYDDNTCLGIKVTSRRRYR